MSTLYSYRAQQRGFTLTELMVSLTLGLFLIAGVVQLFVGSKSTNNTLNAVSDIQQNGRIAIERLKTSLRMAGHMGCSNLAVSGAEETAVGLPYTFDLDSVLIGKNSNANSKTGTDVIEIVTSTGAAADMQVSMTATDSDIDLISNPNNIQAGDTLVITDCIHSDIFVATNVTNNDVIKHKKNNSDGDPVNKNRHLTHNYQDNALVTKVSHVVYDIQDSGRTDKSGNIIFSLFETRDGGAPTEVVSGIENMTITYGVDAGVNGSVDEYKTVTKLTNDGDNWGDVVSVRIVLVASTEGDSGADSHDYRRGGSVVSPTDNRIRKVFTTTVNLRNRIS